MCLLVALHRVHPDSPLVVAANRDELLAREATAMTVLDEGPPRVLGGRDHAAGGTWLAINELGVVGDLTNRPAGQRDQARRSRGEWPLFLAGFETAAEAAEAFVAAFAPADFNPGWVLVGDGRQLFYIDMTERVGHPVELEPGTHILENRPLDGPSAKVDLLRRRLRGIDSVRGDELTERLRSLLASHAVPSAAEAEARQGFDGSPPRPPAANAACVHLGAYGTRSATIVRTAAGAPPRVWSADGPLCRAPLVEVTGLWKAATAAEEVGASG
ncbi:MAG: NRDE family protein [Thermoanaerobaculia bacterium]